MSISHSRFPLAKKSLEKISRFSAKSFPVFSQDRGQYEIISHMDSIDRKIISALQRDGRITITALADLTHTSVSACHRRLRDLENSGVVEGYTAKINASSIGKGFQAIVFITLREGEGRVLKDFEDGLADISEVTEAHRLFGDPDFLVRVATEDLLAFQKLYDDSLTHLPGVLKLSTTLIMKSVVEARPYAI